MGDPPLVDWDGFDNLWQQARLAINAAGQGYDVGYVLVGAGGAVGAYEEHDPVSLIFDVTDLETRYVGSGGFGKFLRASDIHATKRHATTGEQQNIGTRPFFSPS